MKKRILSLVLAFIMVVSLLPVTAFAETVLSSQTYINGVLLEENVTYSNVSGFNCGGAIKSGTAVYKDGVLTLTDVNIIEESENSGTIQYTGTGTLEIVFVGSNKVQSRGMPSSSINATNGSLKLKSEESSKKQTIGPDNREAGAVGVQIDADTGTLTVEGGCFEMPAGENAGCGIKAGGNVTLKNTTLTAATSINGQYGICSRKGTVEIVNSTVTAYGLTPPSWDKVGYGISAQAIVFDNSTVTANGSTAALSAAPTLKNYVDKKIEANASGDSAAVIDADALSTNNNSYVYVKINPIYNQDLTVMNGDNAAEEGKDKDYYWVGGALHICKDGLTISNDSETQNSIVVDSGVSNLTLDGVKIIPTEDSINCGIDSYADKLTITLVGDNQIGNAVTYAKDTTKADDYLVNCGVCGDITFTGEGNLTIYDKEIGLLVTNVTFDEDFTGTLTVEDYGDSASGCAISASDDVKLLGGTFVLKSYNSDGIHVETNGDVTIDNANVTINSGREELNPGEGIGVNGIFVKEGNVTISGEADVAVGGHDYGIYVGEGNITIGKDNDDTVVQVLADGYNGGIKTDDGNIEIKAGTVKTRSHKWAIGVGTTEGDGGNGDITISGSKTQVVAFGGVENNTDYHYGCGIYAVGGSVTVMDGAGVIAKGYDYGIGAENNVLIRGAATNVNAEGGYSAPDVSPTFVNDDPLDAINAYGIFSKNGSITVKGGTIVAHGCDGAFSEAPDLTGYMVSEVPTWAILGGDDATSAVKKSEASACDSVKYAEIFSKILKETLSIDAEKKVRIGNSNSEITAAKLDCYGVSYASSTDLLTLNGFTQDMSSKADTLQNVYAIKLPGGTKLKLEGDNSITVSKSSVMAYGVYAGGDLTIEGPGSLKVSGGVQGKTTGVAANNGTLTIGTTMATIKNATANGMPIKSVKGTVAGGKLVRSNGNYPLSISFDPIIVVEKKNEADYPVAGEANAAYQLYTVSAENVASGTTLKLEWKNGDAWNGSAPAGVMLDTDGEITTTNATVAGTYTFRITNNLADNVVGFVSSGEVTLTVENVQTHTVTIDGNIKNGTVTATPTNVASGTDVTLTVTPYDGYHLGSLTVTKNGGGTVTVTSNKFTMPNVDVTVTAVFVKNDGPTPDDHDWDYEKLAKAGMVAAGVVTTVVVTKIVVDRVHEIKAAKIAAAEAAAEATPVIKAEEMPMVAMGSSGDAVTTLQTELNAQGYNCGEVDGIFGQNTLNAVMAFQTANGLAADGVVGELTWGALL